MDTVYTEPFHISTQLASLDYVSGGRAGWLVAASDSSDEAAAAGRETVRGDRLAQEAADSIEVSRRLWDSWEDDAVIRDVPTGRYLDANKLHYIDFEVGNYPVKGPSIVPRPLQGQLPVLARAGLLAPEAVAAGSVDALLVSAPTAELLAAEIAGTRAVFQGPGAGAGPAPIAELDVLLGARGQDAAGRLAELEAHTQTAERGLFSAFFLGEGLRLREHLGRPRALLPLPKPGPAPRPGCRQWARQSPAPLWKTPGPAAPAPGTATARSCWC